MARITLEQFKARYPEFQDSQRYPDSYLDLKIDDIHECEIGEAAFGCFYGRALATLAAHYIALDDISKSSGVGGSVALNPVASQSEGGVSESYAVQAADQKSNDADGLLRSTLYGQQFLRLRELAINPVASSGEHQTTRPVLTRYR